MIRASISKPAWAEVGLLPPAAQARIRDLVGAAAVDELTRASGVEWLAFEIEARLADAIYEALGPDEARALYRRKTVRSFDIPLIKPALEGALRLFGASPASLVKMTGRAWAVASRNCGSYSCEDESGKRRCVSVVRGFPARLYRRSEAWVESALGGYEGFFAPFRLQGRASVGELDVGGGNARFVLEW